jgi:16S rRNA (cytosine967-C5)-methyltransferase
VKAVRGVSPARGAAFPILLRVERGRAHADDLLRGNPVDALSGADRNLAAALVLGVLRWQLWLDAQIRPLLKRPGAKLEPEVRAALRLGAFQLLRMDRIPAHAAIDESVELVKQAGHRFASGMVNAVLRSLARRKGGNEAAPEKRADPSDSAAAVAAHPAWMVERWTAMQRRARSAATGRCSLSRLCAWRAQRPRKNWPAVELSWRRPRFSPVRAWCEPAI